LMLETMTHLYKREDKVIDLYILILYS
jgi:hypothetical protein